MIWEQGAIDVIPSKANRKLPKEFNAEIYKERNKIERFFGRLKASFRRIATRYEKTSQNFLAMIKLASVRLWIEFHESAAYYLPGDLERQIEAFVDYYNNERYHESLNNVTPADVYFGREKAIIREREKIKKLTIQKRRLQHQKQAA